MEAKGGEQNGYTRIGQKLKAACIYFSENVRSIYGEGSKVPATEHDINELARLTFYALDEFRKAIVKQLSEN